MFFWGPIIGPGVIKEKGWLLRCEIFWASWLRNHRLIFFFHWPWTWWVPGSRSIKDSHLKLLKTRVQSLKRDWFRSGWCPCKKKYTFLRWRGIFSWQTPFNGCQYMKSSQIPYFFSISKKTKPHLSLWEMGCKYSIHFSLRGYRWLECELLVFHYQIY